MFPSADQLFKDADFIFQQDLTLAHTTKSTKGLLNDHGVDALDWPANSPDLNPIENLSTTFKFEMHLYIHILHIYTYIYMCMCIYECYQTINRIQHLIHRTVVATLFAHRIADCGIAYLVSDLRLCVLNAAPSENSWWRFTANHRTVFTDEMRMTIARKISCSPNEHTCKYFQNICVYLYIHNKYTAHTHTYYVNKNLFWMWLITVLIIYVFIYIYTVYVCVYIVYIYYTHTQTQIKCVNVI